MQPSGELLFGQNARHGCIGNQHLRLPVVELLIVCGSGWLAGRRKDGRHQLFTLAATCEDICQGLIEATVAMR